MDTVIAACLLFGYCRHCCSCLLSVWLLQTLVKAACYLFGFCSSYQRFVASHKAMLVAPPVLHFLPCYCCQAVRELLSWMHTSLAIHPTCVPGSTYGVTICVVLSSIVKEYLGPYLSSANGAQHLATRLVRYVQPMEAQSLQWRTLTETKACQAPHSSANGRRNSNMRVVLP